MRGPIKVTVKGGPKPKLVRVTPEEEIKGRGGDANAGKPLGGKGTLWPRGGGQLASVRPDLCNPV